MHVNSFNLDSAKLPVNWFETKVDLEISLLKDTDENWKEDILSDLKKRNIREHLNIDKISISYENIKDHWTRSETFIYLHREKKINCLLEINTKQKRSLSVAGFEAFLMIKLRKSNNKYEMVVFILLSYYLIRFFNN